MGFCFNKKNKTLFIVFGLLIIATYLLCFYDDFLGRIVATFIASILAIFSFIDIRQAILKK